MYDKVNADMKFLDRENEIIKFWEDNDIFRKSIESREGQPSFTFYDGPPTANGKPHIGHIITRAIKDIIPRYKTMKGFKVLRKAGWDTHGLPVELEVEKAIGINGKPEIENYGIEPFIKKCKESVWKYKKEWEDMSRQVGFWADMEEPYVTYNNNYIESVWWALKKIWDAGLLYKGYRVVPYCPRCGTALSSHEVAQGYKDVKESSVFVKFKASDKDEYLLAWTTTPWTLPSNVALVVNADEQYVRAQLGGEVYILAQALATAVLGEGCEILESFPGKALEGMSYEPLFDFQRGLEGDKKAYYVACDSYVTLTDGTGIVHTAPAFGEDDARVGNKYDLPFVQMVNEQGLFLDKVEPWAGKFVKEADPLIIKHLASTGQLFRECEYEHSYPFCWRCDTTLLYYARDAWFIRMSALREKLIKNNDTINWYPDNIKKGRFGSFLDNVVDWSLSRERYWGTPLPIWICDCGHRHAVGSIQELCSMSDAPADIELHKPYIDEVYLNCPQCGGKMKRVPEVIDCWFDAGSMPFAQWHYPFENHEIFDDNFPADFISEAMDQTRGWFYALLAISTLLFDKAPYKNVIVLGLVQDKDGQKMSKHKGNVVDPWTILNKQGADAVRWYFYTNSAPWLPSRFYEEAVDEAQRKFMGTLWNTYAFYVLYANIDGYSPSACPGEGKQTLMDKWIISKLNNLANFVDSSLASYKITEAARAMNEFVDELSNWYVRRSRERFWGSEMTDDKLSAYKTLYTVLTSLAKLSAPFVPFMSEAIYRNLRLENEPLSVHLCDFPVADESLMDNELERNMDMILKIVSLGRSARNNANIKNRQPLSQMFVKAEQMSGQYTEIIADELNVKAVSFIDDVTGYISYRFKPQLRTLGPKYGKQLKAISDYLANADGLQLMEQLNGGLIKFTVDGTEVELTKEDVLIETAQREGFMAESDKGFTVVLSTTLTDELIEEGFVREIISKIQTMRKEAGFEVTNKITLYYQDNERIAGVIQRNEALIKAEVLATAAVNGSDGYSKEWNINGEKVVLGVKREAI